MIGSVNGCIKLGNCSETAGNIDAAREYYKKALLICQKFAGKDGSAIKKNEPKNDILKKVFRANAEKFFDVMVRLSEIYYKLSLNVTAKQGFFALIAAAGDAQTSLTIYYDMIGTASVIFGTSYTYAIILPRYGYNTEKIIKITTEYITVT